MQLIYFSQDELIRMLELGGKDSDLLSRSGRYLICNVTYVITVFQKPSLS